MLKSALRRMIDVFPAAVLQRGKDYQEKGHVLNVRLSDGLLKARVKGSSSQIYDVHIDLKTWPESHGRCGCPYRINCKHAAACLYELESRERHPVDSTSSNVKNDEWRHRQAFAIHEEIFNADETEWYSDVTESHNDFFSYQLGIKIDNQTVSILPLIVDLIRRMDRESLECLPDHKQLKLPFAQGKVLQISLGRIKPLLRLLLQYWSRIVTKDPDLQVNRYQLILMQEAELAIAATSARWRGTEKLQDQLHQLAKRTSLPEVPVPLGLKTYLRDYQQQGLNWLQYLRSSQFGGVLADDMGLGKTVQTLAHLQYEKEQGRLNKASLIIAPTSLVWNWYDEAKRFTPELKALVFHGSDRHRDNFDDYDLVISTYGLIQRDKVRFLEYSFYYLILDEAQSIKNSR